MTFHWGKFDSLTKQVQQMILHWHGQLMEHQILAWSTLKNKQPAEAVEQIAGFRLLVRHYRSVSFFDSALRRKNPSSFFQGWELWGYVKRWNRLE